MTPAAVTPAAKPQRKDGRSTRKADGHRRQLARASAPAVPRRVSGPVRKRAVAQPVAPARHAPHPGIRAIAFIQAMPEHRLLDRLIRGRSWIPLLGILLAGIVAMQVEVLKLGASIGRSLQRTTMLQSRNEQLRESVASLADDQRIERLAAGMGMVMPTPPSVGFLSVGSGQNVGQAISNIHTPSPQSFLSQLASSNAAAAAASGAPAPQTSSSAIASVPTTATATSPSTSSAATGMSGTATATPTASPTVSAAPPSSTASSPSAPPGGAPTGVPAATPGGGMSSSGGAAIGTGR
jgi:hypothetical protein